MKIFHPANAKTIVSWIIPIGLILAFGLAFLGYRYLRLSEELVVVKEDFASTTGAFRGQVAELEGEISNAKNENTALTAALQIEKGKNDYFEFQLKGIAGTIGTLEKLSRTDKELLAKYSKVYFLNENYIPSSLTDISSSEYAFKKDEPLQFHSSVWPFLQTLLQGASNGGLPLQIISGYRSFDDQSSLKTGYKFTYGAGTANQFSADQGYSEHQLGTTVDFTTLKLGADFEEFEDTLAYKWLRANAHHFGFVLSYPEGNSYYQFEPWHWRFVGIKLAEKLHAENKYFYDMNQRDIDEYLVFLFD